MSLAEELTQWEATVANHPFHQLTRVVNFFAAPWTLVDAFHALRTWVRPKAYVYISGPDFVTTPTDGPLYFGLRATDYLGGLFERYAIQPYVMLDREDREDAHLRMFERDRHGNPCGRLLDRTRPLMEQQIGDGTHVEVFCDREQPTDGWYLRSLHIPPPLQWRRWGDISHQDWAGYEVDNDL